MTDPNFKLAINILNKNKIKYWLCFGTLLGIIRNKQLIEWDHDIDIGIMKNIKIEKVIIKLFLKNGFKMKKKFFKGDGLISFVRKNGKIIDINIHESFIRNKKKMVICQWYVPKNLLFKLIDALSSASSYKSNLSWIFNKLTFLEKFFLKIKNYLIKKNNFFIRLGYAHPLTLINKIEKKNLNNLKVKIPKNSVAYLKYIYGPFWKIPKKNFVWYKNKTILYKL